MKTGKKELKINPAPRLIDQFVPSKIYLQAPADWMVSLVLPTLLLTAPTVLCWTASIGILGVVFSLFM